MQLDPEIVAEARAWFSRAGQDLRAADFEMTANPPLCADIAFHAQQAAEKAMKGFLAFHGRVFRKTHNLVELGKACSEVDSDLEELLLETAPLTEYAWRYRYPGESFEPPIAEARQAVGIARQAFDVLLSKLPTEVNPANSQ